MIINKRNTMYDPNDIVIPLEDQAPERYAMELKEAHRRAQRMRTELNKALGSLDALDHIIEKVSEPSLVEEDYHDHANAASSALWDAIEASDRALSLGHEANKHIFAVSRVFMQRRWKAIRLAREAEQKAKRKAKSPK